MIRSITNMFLFSILSCVACLAVDSPAPNDDAAATEGDADEPDSGDPGEETGSVPSGATNLLDSDPGTPEGCAELETLLEMALFELSACTSDDECVVFDDGDRCGCDFAALPFAQPILEPMYEILDAAGCAPNCPDACLAAAAAVCHEGRCEIRQKF